jgi:hypothetical protein
MAMAAIGETLPVTRSAARAKVSEAAVSAPLNPCELEIDLFCKGMRVDPSCTLEADGRPILRTRAGLGSGLEIIIPGPLKDVWVNVPVVEKFASRSCYRLAQSKNAYAVFDDRQGFEYPVRLSSEPAWYDRETSRGVPMHRVGVLQGTYLGIYISNSCGFWYHHPPCNCKFFTTRLNVGVNEVALKDVEDVVEVAQAAKAESGVTFVHFNSGFQTNQDLDRAAPYVKAVKSRVGTLVGVQLTPTRDLWKYDRLIDLGADHFSFCYEFQNPVYFARYCPGKETRQRRLLGRNHRRNRAAVRHPEGDRLHHEPGRLPHRVHFPAHRRRRHGGLGPAALRGHDRGVPLRLRSLPPQRHSHGRDAQYRGQPGGAAGRHAVSRPGQLGCVLVRREAQGHEASRAPLLLVETPAEEN